MRPAIEQTREGFSLRIERIFAAPHPLVWKCWTEPQHMARWWCPEGFRTTFSEVDLRVGGNWRTGMRSPDGNDYIMAGTYRILQPFERIVTSQFWEQNDLEPAVTAEISVVLSESDGRTHMVFVHSQLGTEASALSHGNGWSGAFDYLAGHVEGRGGIPEFKTAEAQGS